MNSLPDIDSFVLPDEDEVAARHARAARQKSSRTLNPWIGTFVVGVLAVIVSVSAVVIGKDQLLTWIGAAPEAQPDVVAIALQQHDGALKTLDVLVNELTERYERVSVRTTEHSDELGVVSQRVQATELKIDALAKQYTAQQKAREAAAAKPSIMSPSARISLPVSPVFLISIRSLSGTPLVSLRQGVERSELLRPGDTWKGWTLEDADVMRKTARFSVGNKTQELRLQ